jgi:TolB-like protein/Flp pilus assembly protein TadD
MDVLVYLAANPERVVSKEELLTVVWGGAFVEEGALAQAIHSLRKALGDDARQPRFIQTVPKRGYRLVAAIAENEAPEEIHDELGSPARLPAPVSRADITATPASWRWFRQFSLVAAGLMAIVACWLTWDGSGSRWSAQAVGDDRPTIVVLPFENLGRPQDAFFADGLTEEITKDLAALRSLRVTSRTSAMLYRGIRKPLRDVAQELGVDYVLEGTVRWEIGPNGHPRVRVTPQLIHAADDAHVWADAYNRELQDIFEVQQEISRRVIGALGITLFPGEIRRTSRPQPQNLDAYRAYLRGLQLKNQPFYSEKYSLKAATMFERAVALDPAFAAAWAELSQIHSALAFNNDGPPNEMEHAQQALGKATALAPNLPDVLLAEAYFTYRCLGDFDAALEQLSSAAQLFPNDAGVFESLGYVLRRKGRLKESITMLKNAAGLNPRFSETLWGIGETYRAMRNYEQADRYFEQAISLAPDEPHFWQERVLNRFAWNGDVREARELLGRAPVLESFELTATAFQLDLYERQYERALMRLTPDQVRGLPAPDSSRIAMLEVFARERLGDRQGALKAAEANLIDLQARLALFPKEAISHAYLAIALAQLGREAEAFAEAEQAVRLKSHDAFNGPPTIQAYAMVEAILGYRQKSIGRLRRLFKLDYRSAISSAELRLDPVWDSLRREPAYENLLQVSEH